MSATTVRMLQAHCSIWIKVPVAARVLATRPEDSELQLAVSIRAPVHTS